MQLPPSWKKSNKYGKVIGHLINLGYGKPAAKSMTEKAMIDARKGKGK